MTETTASQPTADTWAGVIPQVLEGDILNQRAWRMPDIVIYQHAPEEWWVAPLDEELPLVRLNRMGAALLGAMDGRMTIGALLNQYGKWVCSPTQHNGRWHLERWAQPRFSLAYYGTEPPSGHTAEAKWDLLLQKVREGWHQNVKSETEDHLSKFHVQGIQGPHGHFEIIETTVSHLFREPCEAMNGLTYGRLLGRTLRQMGWLTPKPRHIVEVGAGLGYVSQEFAGELSPGERKGIDYTFLDLTGPFLNSQTSLARKAGWTANAIQANAENMPLANQSVDLLIDNENLADMTPVQFSSEELLTFKGANPLHEDALNLIRRMRLPLRPPFPDEVIFNYGAIQFLQEVWRVLKPGGRAILIEFGIEHDWPSPVRLPGHLYLAPILPGTAQTLFRPSLHRKRIGQGARRAAPKTHRPALPQRLRPGLVWPVGLQGSSVGKTRQHEHRPATGLQRIRRLPLVHPAVSSELISLPPFLSQVFHFSGFVDQDPFAEAKVADQADVNAEGFHHSS
jgi:SAM-dependent methyltransferase